VRLDHLLSKELHRTPSHVGVIVAASVRVHARWWWRAPVPPQSVPSGWCLGVGTGLLEKCGNTERALLHGRASTLLGPERTTGRSSGWWLFFLGRSGPASPVGGVRSRFVWSLRIVQWTRASFVSVACLCRDFLMCVLVKLSRAHGGCLGIRSR
jgi:hypothetical protein